MPKSLKRVAEVDTFDFGKSVTDVIAYAKNISKTVNEFVDQIEFLQSRKKQETLDLERLISEKGEIIKLKAELRDKIIEKKSEFLEFVGSKQREIETIEAQLATDKQNLANANDQFSKTIREKQNELELRSTELEKEKANIREAIKQELKADFDKLVGLQEENVKQSDVIVEASKKIKLDRDKLDKDIEIQAEQKALLDAKLQKIADKERELSVREKNIVETEQKMADTRSGITQAVADIETQISVIKRERSKNANDKKAIEDMRIALNKRSGELDTREIHLADREATKQTHSVV